MLRNTFSLQKVGSELSSTTKGRNQHTPKENWITRAIKSAKLEGSKRSPMGNSSLSENEEMPELTPREDMSTNSLSSGLKGQCHDDFAVLGQFCAKIFT